MAESISKPESEKKQLEDRLFGHLYNETFYSDDAFKAEKFLLEIHPYFQRDRRKKVLL